MELLPLVALAVYHRVKKSSLSRLVYLGFLVTVSRLIGLRRNITLFSRTPTNFCCCLAIMVTMQRCVIVSVHFSFLLWKIVLLVVVAGWFVVGSVGCCRSARPSVSGWLPTKVSGNSIDFGVEKEYACLSPIFIPFISCQFGRPPLLQQQQKRREKRKDPMICWGSSLWCWKAQQSLFLIANKSQHSPLTSNISLSSLSWYNNTFRSQNVDG